MKTIVLGYDETEPAKRALERAADLAEAFDSKLIVTSVAPILVGAGRSAGPTDPTDPFGKHLQELTHARDYLAGRKLEAEYVPAVAEERKADLIVVGTREPNILERLLGQSVSQAVSHRAHCDVLIVH